MQIGVDSYSYHRYFGDLRPGEVPRAGPRWPLSPEPVLAHAAELGVEYVFLETCFLPAPDDLDPAELIGKVDRVGFSWGHPWPSGTDHGLHAGHGSTGEADLYRWAELAASLGHPVMRVTAGTSSTSSAAASTGWNVTSCAPEPGHYLSTSRTRAIRASRSARNLSSATRLPSTITRRCSCKPRHSRASSARSLAPVRSSW